MITSKLLNPQEEKEKGERGGRARERERNPSISYAAVTAQPLHILHR